MYGSELIEYGFFNEAVKALTGRDGIQSSSLVSISVLKTHIETTLVRCFRGHPFIFTHLNIVVDRSMKVFNQLFCSFSLIRY